MKIIGQMVVGPGEGDRWLEECLLEMKKRCDDIVVVLNNADKKTYQVVDRIAHFYTDDREWGLYQNKIKEDLLMMTGSMFKPDWVLALDADEFLEESCDRKALEELASHPFDVGFSFWFLNFWDTPARYREDHVFEDVRFFKYTPEKGLNYKAQPLHGGQCPIYNGKWASHSSYLIYHYGLMKEEDRKKKYERYKKYDPKAVYLSREWYESLINPNPPLKKIGEFKAPEAIFRKKPINDMAQLKPTNKVYNFLNPHGKVISVDNDKHYRELLNRHGFTFVGAEDRELREEMKVPITHVLNVPVIEDDKNLPNEKEKVQSKQQKLLNEENKGMNSNKCPHCEFNGKTFVALKTHITKKHADKK